MTKNIKHYKLFLLFFFTILIVDLIIGSSSYDLYRRISKPIIIGSLLIYFYFNGKDLPKKIFRPILIALFFSVVGDTALLYENVSPHFFTIGLGAFLLAHVFYSITFAKYWNKKNNSVFWMILTLVIIYGIGLFYALKDNLGPLMIPVIIYILVILGMFITAFKRQDNVNKKSFYFVLIGALLFMISDSILAIDKFLIEVPFSLILIMSTYAFAQLAIAFGILKQD